MISLFIVDGWKIIKMDNLAALTRRKHSKDKKTGNWQDNWRDRGEQWLARVLMVQEKNRFSISFGKCIITKWRKKKTKMFPISTEVVIELIWEVTFGTSCVTKCDSFSSADWLRSDKHGKHHTHHRLAAKQINKATPTHVVETNRSGYSTQHILKPKTLYKWKVESLLN